MAGESYRSLMARLWGPLALLLALASAGCFPQTLVTQPDLTLSIHNQSGDALPAQVTLYWWEYPHRRQRGVVTTATDAQGTVTFTETTAGETIMPLVPHGVPAYNWSFCVEAESYKTLIGTVSDVTPGESVAVTLTVPSGQSLPVCHDYDKLPYHSGTPVNDVEFTNGSKNSRANGATVHGVYVVDAVNER